MSLHRLPLVFGITSLLALSACTGGEECAYERPVAEIKLLPGSTGAINSDQILSAEDSFISCDRDHSYQWSFDRVPVASALTNSNLPNPGTSEIKFQPDEPGTYVVKLVIFDGVSNSVEALHVLEIETDNLPPEADAGDDQSALVGERAVFDGSASFDPETGTEALEYFWTLEDRPEGSRRTTQNIFGADEEEAGFVPDVPGSYVFGLQVSDGFTVSRIDYVGLTAVTTNNPPIAQASESTQPQVTLTPCESVDDIQLNGSRSFDPEGNALDYEWGLVSVPGGSSATAQDFSDPTSDRPSFNSDVPGDYVFDLRVYDGMLWSAWDEVTVTTQDPSLNSFPTARAGDDLRFEVEARCYSYAGSFKCGDCPNPKSTLDATLSSDPDGDQLNYLWAVTRGSDLEISYPTGPVTTVVPSPVKAEFGKKITRSWTIDLKVSDCGGESTDSLEMVVVCEGIED